MLRLSIVCMVLSASLTGCFKTPIAAQGTVKNLTKLKSTALATDVSITKSIASVDSQSKDVVTMAVSDTSKLSGTSISISPGSLSISTNIIIEQGADLADTSLTQEVALSGDTQITVAGNGVIIRPSTATVLSKPITLNLPLPVSAGLFLATDYYAIYYKYLDPASNQLMTGFKVVDGNDVKLVYNEAAKQDVIQMDGYFGVYWVVKLNREIPKEDVPPAKLSVEPITNKANTQVFSATGVVAESEIAATQAKPEYVWLKPTLIMQANSRKAILAASASAAGELKNCKADIAESTTDLSALKPIDIAKDLTLTFPIEKLTAHKLFGRFRCLDVDARSTISPWTEALVIDAYKLTGVISVKTSLASAVYPSGTTIPISVKFNNPVQLTGSPILALETGAVDHNAVYKSGSGTSDLLFEYIVQAGDETSALNYVSIGSLSLLGGTLVDSLGVPVSLTLPDLTSAASLASASAIVLDSMAPVAPSSIGFPVSPSTSTSFTVSWAPVSDSSLKKYHAMICADNGCASSCSTVLSSTTPSLTMTANYGGPYYACVQSEDLAGNKSPFVPSSTSLMVIGAGPVVTSVSSDLADGAYKAGQVIPIKVSFSSNVTVTSPSEIRLQLETGSSDESVLLSSYSANVLTFNYTVAATHTSSDLNYISTGALSLGAGGAIRDASTNTNAIPTLPALNAAQSLAGLKAIVIDTTVPGTPVISTPSNPFAISPVTTVTGTSEVGATITVKVNAVTQGTVLSATGSWSYTLPTALGDGTYAIIASATDVAGNVGPFSNATNVTVDTSAPNAPVLNAVTTPTTDTTPPLTGTAEVGMTIIVKANGSQIATTTVDGSGNWSIDASALSDGTYTLDATAVDAGSRNSSVSNSRSLVIDTTAPTLPSSVAVTASGTTTLPVTWTNSADPNFSHHNLKLCTAANCITGCTSVSTSASSPASLLGTNSSTVYACVQGEDSLGHLTAWVPSASAVTISTTEVTVTNVIATAADGYYKAGDSFTINVQFSESVTITGTGLSLLLETGATDRNATYTGGSGTSTLAFSYTVVAGDSATDLDYQSIAALTLGAATVKDTATGLKNAVLTLPPLGGANSLGGNKALILDTTDPTVPSAVGFGGTITNSTSISVSWSPSSDNNFSLHNVKLCTSNDCVGGCGSTSTSISSPKTMTGTNGSTYYACVRGVDLASLFSPWVASILTITVDTTVPTVSSVTSSKTNGSYKVAEVIDLPVQFSEVVNVTNSGDLGLMLETGTTDRKALYLSGTGTSTLTFRYTVQAGDTSSDLDSQSTGALTLGATGTIKDNAGNNATLTLPALGGANSIAGSKAIAIDTTAPAAPAISSPANAAYLGTNVTTVSGTSESGAFITLKDGGTIIGTGTASGTSWSITLGTALTDGLHTLNAMATDAAGNDGNASTNNVITIDTTAPNAPVVTSASVTTNNNQPSIVGTSEASMSITLYANGVSCGTTTADASGNWNVTPSVRADGVTSFTAKATDLLPRTSGVSNAVNITIDTAAPVISSVYSLASNTPVTMTATVSETSTLLWSKVSGGTVTFSNPTALSTTITPSTSGLFDLKLTATDQAGNVSNFPFTITYDNVPPATPTITDVLRSQGETSAQVFWKPVLDDMSKSGDIVYQICKSSTASGCNTTFTTLGLGAAGQYSYQATGLTVAAPVYFSVRAVDEQGNVSAASASVSGNVASGTTTQIATGYNHTCSVVGGVVRCWGANNFGQLGDQGTNDHAFGVPVTGLTAVTKVVNGMDFSCALSSGTVKCWGRNNFGQIGQGNIGGTYPNPMDVGLTSVSDIDAGMNHVCVVHSSGVKCWGANSAGQLGNGLTADSGSIVPAGSLTGITKVALGDFHSCALSSTATYCWGANGQNQVNGGAAVINTPTQISGVTNATAIGAGNDFTCALVGTTLKCWGGNGQGQLGRSDRNQTATPTDITAFTGVTSFTLGAQFGCAVASSLTYCWGHNFDGQFGDGTTVSPSIPVQVNGLQNVVAGAHYGCGIFSGIAKCWGENRRGQLGIGASDMKSFPVEVSSSIAAVDSKIAMGLKHSCITAGGYVYCWGSNWAGQLGSGSTVDNMNPTAVPGITNAVAVSAGENFTCVLLSTGAVKCWGAGANGQLGNGTSTASLTPVNVNTVANVNRLVSSGQTTCAIQTNGYLYCWGGNSNGMIGDNTSTDRNVPTQPMGMGTIMFQDVATGPSHTCAVKSGTNELYCWGQNTNSQLGDSTTTSRLAPVLAAQSNVAKVAVGGNSTCVILATDGSVRCWGLNSSGQLGNGTGVNSSSPVQAGTITGVTAITMSQNSACTLSAGENVFCWGQNESMQLSGDAGGDRWAPGEVLGLSRVKAIGLGVGRSCHVHDTNHLSCIGDGAGGSFGPKVPTVLLPTIKVSVQ